MTIDYLIKWWTPKNSIDQTGNGCRFHEIHLISVQELFLLKVLIIWFLAGYRRR